MPYVDPETVTAPRKYVRAVEVLYNSAPGEGGFSIARLNWNGNNALGIRWNGDEDSAVGNPQSHSRPTWFIFPEELEPVILQWVDERIQSQPGGLLERYREMASDTDREREASEWSEGLIGDASTQG